MKRMYKSYLKWSVMVLLPALAALIGSLGELYQWQDAPKWVATVNIVAVFMGNLIYKQVKTKGRAK